MPENIQFSWKMNSNGNPAGFPLIWIHGFMGRGPDWLPLTETYFSNYNNILIDLPGHGESPIHDPLTFERLLEILLDQLSEQGIETFIPIGYSMGGRIAFHLQQKSPANIPGLILLSAAPGLKTDLEREARRNADSELMDDLERKEMQHFLEAWYQLELFKSIFGNKPLLNDLIRSRSFNSPLQLRKSLEIMGNGALPSLWNTLDEISCPSLLISGELDSKYCGINNEMIHILPQAEHEIISGGDHAFFLEKSLETARLIKQFLRTKIEGEISVSN